VIDGIDERGEKRANELVEKYGGCPTVDDCLNHDSQDSRILRIFKIQPQKNKPTEVENETRGTKTL